MANWDQNIDKLDYAFQPIIHSFTGKIYGVEALIRNVQNISGLNAIDDLFNMAFNDDYLYELDLQLREKAIKKFSNIKIEDLKLFYNLDNRIIYNKNFSYGNTSKILKKTTKKLIIKGSKTNSVLLLFKRKLEYEYKNVILIIQKIANNQS